MKIENINIHSLPLLPIPERRNLPQISGIYFVISDEKNIEYIGKADNINKRWKTHACCAELDSPKKCKIAWLGINNKNELDSIEQELILAFNPRLNIRHKSTPKISFDKLKAKELKERREKLNLTQKELSELLDVKQNTVYRWETGKLSISRIVGLAFEIIEQRLKESRIS